jgi:hypothetical protein
VGKNRNAFKICFDNLKGRDNLRDLDGEGRAMLK